MANKVGFIVKDRETFDNGVAKVTIRMLHSDKPTLATNELPLILHSLKDSQYVDAEVQIGFTYTFPFVLSVGHGFPYVFNFEIEKEGLLTLT